MSAKEASYLLRIAQDLNPELKRQEQKKAQQIRWQMTAQEINQILHASTPLSPLTYLSQKNITTLHPLLRGSYVIMRTQRRTYIGQVLDMYKKGESSRYGSIDSSTSLEGLSWLSLRIYLPLTVDAVLTNSDEESDAGIDTTGTEFTCTVNGKKFHLHTHAPINNAILNLGLHALVDENVLRKLLTPLAASRWNALHCAKLKPILAK
ncbi:hypothetical protein C0992_010163, partial [Termitomyces sp. T32_za158]